MHTNIGLFIPTFNAGNFFKQVLQSIDSQSISVQKLIIDSGSTDHTIALASQHGFKTIDIPPSTFDHGGTRNKALEILNDCEIVIFLSQDVVLQNQYSLQQLIQPLIHNKQIAATYGRQLPHSNANAIAAFERSFNYPANNRFQNNENIQTLGYGVTFCSNSFAAYKQNCVKDVGMFPSPIIFGEDAFIAGKLVLANKTVFYNSNATAFHSHNYSLKQQFKRYFDMGFFFKQNLWMSNAFGKPKAKAVNFIITGTKHLLQNKWYAIPKFYALVVAKFLGYKLGVCHNHLPLWFIKKCSLNSNYFNK